MRFLLSAALFPLLIACSGGGDPDGDSKDAKAADSAATASASLPNLADQAIDDGQVLGEMLSRVDSAETAEEIRPAIDAMVEEYRVILQTMEQMDSPSFSDMAALASRARPMAETQQRVAIEIKRIYTDHPEAAEILREALDDLGREDDFGR